MRMSCPSLGAAHPGDFRQSQDPSENINGIAGLDLIHTDRAGQIKPTGARAPELLQLSSAGETLPDVVGVGTNIKSFAAQDRKIDFRRGNTIDAVAVDVNEARLALDHLSLSRQFVERNAALLDGRNHRWHLIKIAPVFVESRADIFLG